MERSEIEECSIYRNSIYGTHVIASRLRAVFDDHICTTVYDPARQKCKELKNAAGVQSNEKTNNDLGLVLIDAQAVSKPAANIIMGTINISGPGKYPRLSIGGLSRYKSQKKSA